MANPVDEAVEYVETLAPYPTSETGGLLRNSPWWLISGGFHLVLLLGAALIYVERAMAIEDIGVEIAVSGPVSRVAPKEIEPERADFTRRGIPADDKDFAPSTEPIIFFPEAELGDHNESKDGEEYKKMKGDSELFLSYIRGEAGGPRGRQTGKTPGVYDTMGVGIGGGSGGRYGGRFGG